MTVRMDAWPDFFRARLAPEGEGGGIGVAPTCAPKSEAYPPSGGISPYLAWCISLALAPVEMTPSKPEKLNPRPAGALFRGLANEATSPRGAHRKDLPPHALGRAGPLTHTG